MLSNLGGSCNQMNKSNEFKKKSENQSMNLLYGFLSITSSPDSLRASSIYHCLYLKLFNSMGYLNLSTLFGPINTNKPKGCASKDMPHFSSEYIDIYEIWPTNISIFGVVFRDILSILVIIRV
jgi:hypothetical protein